MRVALVGECMVEFKEQLDGSMRRSYGGDTLNTAVYLARLGIEVDYVTALGDDGWSNEMLEAWRAEGIGTRHVHQLPDQLPGLYVIQTDPSGERHFLYWRDSAAARQLLEHLDLEALHDFDVIYISGVSYSIYDAPAREILLTALAKARAKGRRIVFDTNFRPRGWPDRAAAEDIYERMFALSEIILASTQDLSLLFGPEGVARLLRHAAGKEIVLKLDRPAVRVFHAGQDKEVEAHPVADVIDTTGAGDSFAAAYLAVRWRGKPPMVAARAGHDLAGLIVRHPGAIVPREAMAHIMAEGSIR